MAIDFTTPSAGDGTSIVALSDSSVTSGVSVLIASPTLTSVSLTFFFSSRRRHTSFSRDWSSDVCSSDLYDQLGSAFSDQPDDVSLWDLPRFVEEVEQVRTALKLDTGNFYLLGQSWGGMLAKIGRASCRERV